MNSENTATSSPDENESPVETASPEIEETAETSASPESEIEKYRDMALRARAELDNYRKRVIREKEESIRYANLALLERLLPVIDNFDFGLMAARNSAEASAVVSGFDMVRKQLTDFLKDQGVEAIEAEGHPFDPNVHEAMGNEASPSVPEGHVVREVRKGYKLRDRLLRPASVFVSSGSAAE